MEYGIMKMDTQTKEQKRKRMAFRNTVLRSLAVAGVVSVALIAPKMTRLLKELDRPAKNRQRLYQRISQALSRLEHDKLITITGEGGARRVKLTEKGKELLHELEFREYAIPEQAFWDGKWRVLVFDMSEKRRRTRDQLRRLLQGQRFVRMQDSVWVYPYPCDEFVALVRAHLRSGVGEMRYFVAEGLESDKALRKHFRLSI
jgi:predicted transcriptional regulator/CRISPR/Cas system-associated endoribonuclease Cas2